MSTAWMIVLILLGIVLVLGIIRVIFFPTYEGFWGFVLEILFIDVIDEWFD